MAPSVKKPETRCGMIQYEIKGLELLEPAKRKRILDRFPQDTLHILNQSKENAWVPVEFDIQLINCLAGELSEKDFTDFCVKICRSQIESSIIGPFIRSSLHMFKISPKSILKIAPYLWNTCYRNCGTMSVAEIGDTSLTIILNDLPLMMVENRSYLLAIAAFIKGMDAFTTAKHSKVDIHEQSKMNKRAVFAVCWD